MKNVICACVHACVCACLCLRACVCARTVNTACICFTRPRFLPVEEASLSTSSRQTGDQLIPSQHQTRFKCVEKKQKWFVNEEKKKRQCREGRRRKKRRPKQKIERGGVDKWNGILKLNPKKKKDSINTGGCIAVVSDFTDSIFLAVPRTHPPHSVCPVKEHYHLATR